MKNIQLLQTDISASNIGLGCMRIAEMDINSAEKLIRGSMEVGINFFDHADIYADGKSEQLFAEAINMNETIREKMIIQSKCGIRNGYYDFSKEHILNSVDGSLKRLKTDYLDILLLHRPDTLMEPELISEVFDELYNTGKVRYFGVSNQNPMQIELLNKYLNKKVIFNQLQFSIMHTGVIDSGFNVNMKVDSAIDRDGQILEYCRLKDINIQAWSPFQYGFFEGVFLDNEKFPELNNKLKEIATKYNVSTMAVAISWILTHPAQIQTIVGTTNIDRVREISKGSEIKLTRQEWYEIYKSAGNWLP